jgi:hypothetical protein
MVLVASPLVVVGAMVDLVTGTLVVVNLLSCSSVLKEGQ